MRKGLADFTQASEKRWADNALELQRLNERINALEKEIRSERKNILLQLENRLLRAKLQLPPADDEG